MVKLTMVVPTYNLGRYVSRTLKTIAKQTVPFELWLVDDHSTDGTGRLIEAFAAEHPDAHAKVFDQHVGVSVARNYGLDHATGDVIAFVDGDDLLAPDFVATLMAGFAHEGVVAASVGYEWWSRSGGGGTMQYLDQAAMFQQVSRRGTAMGGYVWNKAFSMAALAHNHLRFDESLPLAEDYLFTASFVAATPGLYAYAPKVRYTKVNRPGSTIHTANFGARRGEEAVFACIDQMGAKLLQPR